MSRLEDIGRAILELQRIVTAKHTATSEGELEQLVPAAAALRDALVQHLIKSAAAAKMMGAPTSHSNGDGPVIISAAQQHEYCGAVNGLLRAVRELFPDALEFSSALIACSNKAWWAHFASKMQPVEQTTGECVLEMQQRRSSGSSNATGDELQQQQRSSGARVVDRFAAAEAVANQWWEAVLVSVCGVQSIQECYPADVPATQEAIVVTAIATMCLYVLGPPVTSGGEAAAASVQRRAVALVTSLPQSTDGAAVVRAVARLLCKHLLQLCARKRAQAKRKNAGGNDGTPVASSVAAFAALVEHQGTLALHRWFSLLAAICRGIESRVNGGSAGGRASGLGAAAATTTSPSTPAAAYVLPLVGLREVLTRQDVLRAALDCRFTNWVRKLLAAPSSYFAPNQLRQGAEAMNNSSSNNNIGTGCDLDIFATCLVHCALRASRVDTSVSEHSRPIKCGSASLLLHHVAQRLCSSGGGVGEGDEQDGVETGGGDMAVGELPRLTLSRGTLQLVRLALLHDGLPFPPPRPTEGFGVYSRFCPCCLHVCMEVRRAVSVAGLVLPLAEPDIEPWANMVWRDGPNAFVGTATSFRADSPARRRAMPSVPHVSLVAASSSEEDGGAEAPHPQQQGDGAAPGGRSPRQRRQLHVRENATVTQAELPRLFSPVQRAAAVFRLALIDGGCAVAASAANSSASSPSSAAAAGEVGRVPAVVWPCAADGLLEALEHDHHHMDNATWLAVSAAATVAACAALLRFPCDLALSRVARVMHCRARRETPTPAAASSASGAQQSSMQPPASLFTRLLDELSSGSAHRPRTSELFDSVNPLVFAEWEKCFAACCEEALRQPASSTVWQQQQRQNPLSAGKKAAGRDDAAAAAPSEKPRPTRESSLSSRNGGTSVIVWIDTSMSASFLFGVDAAHERETTGSVGQKPISKPKKQVDIAAAAAEQGAAGGSRTGSKATAAAQDDEDDADSIDGGDASAAPAWVPIWITLLPEGSALASGRHRECVAPVLTGCCGVVCADTALNCPLRPGDLVFFTPACPEDEAHAVAESGGAEQPAVLLPRVVLRAWRLVPGATALVPNLAVRRCEGTQRSFRLTLTSGEDGYAPLSLRGSAACGPDAACVAAWPMAQWFAVLRHVGRSAATAASGVAAPSSSSSQQQQQQAEQRQIAAIMHLFGPGFASAAARGALRSFWCALRDVAVPFLAGGSAPLYWTVQRPPSSSSREDPIASGAALWPPPYLSLGGSSFGVVQELDAWRGNVSLDVADAFLEG